MDKDSGPSEGGGFTYQTLYTVIVGRREISKIGTVVRMRCIIR
jgi:hypothetical protein